MRMWFGIAIIVLLSLLYWCIIRPPGGWVTPNERKERQTSEEIRSLCSSMIILSVGFVEDFPADSLEKTLSAIMKDEFVGKHVRSRIIQGRNYSFELLMKGIDAWERPLIYIWNEEEGIIIIRSMGRNGCDESGQGDDIQFKMNIGATLKYFEQFRQQEENNNCCSADPNKGQ